MRAFILRRVALLAGAGGVILIGPAVCGGRHTP